MGACVDLSTAFHPQTDGQTERVNQTLEQFLQIFCNYDQDNWVDLLPLAEFTYNNTVTNAHGMTPFFVNYGAHPSAFRNEIKTPWTNDDGEAFAEDIKKVQEIAKDALEETRSRMGRYYDKKVQDHPKFEEDDEVLIDA